MGEKEGGNALSVVVVVALTSLEDLIEGRGQPGHFIALHYFWCILIHMNLWTNVYCLFTIECTAAL